MPREKCIHRPAAGIYIFVLDSMAMPIHLRVDASTGDGSFRATICVGPVGIFVEVTAHDVREAIHDAADLCAIGLRQRGYAVSAAEVLDSLDTIDSTPGVMDPTA